MHILLVLACSAILVTCAGQETTENPSSEVNDSYCYGTDSEKPEKYYYGTKTAYPFVKGTEYEELSSIPGCSPVKFWVTIRHGTRNPEVKVINKMGDLEMIRDEILQNHSNGTSGELCSEDLELLRNWVLNKNITVEYQQFLVDQGWDDLRTLAKDYQAVYPELLLDQYDPKHFLFRHTDIERTVASYKAFVEGLFGEDAYKNITLDPIPEKSILLDPYRTCDLYQEQNTAAKQPGKDIENFKDSEIIKDMLANVSMRLGYDTPLEYDDVSVMYEMCRFEQSWFLNKSSAWCTPFIFEDIKIFEFYEDLKHQYKSGYVGKLNPNMPCALIQDMMKKLENDDGPVVTAYFSHSDMLMLYYVGMGLFKDKETLTASNMDIMGDRQWSTSYMTPFAANVAIIKYSCSANDTKSSTKLRFFLNQKPLELDGCEEGLCELEDILNKYNNYYKADCEKMYCRIGNSAGAREISIFTLVTIIVYSFFKSF